MKFTTYVLLFCMVVLVQSTRINSAKTNSYYKHNECTENYDWCISNTREGLGDWIDRQYRIFTGKNICLDLFRICKEYN